MLYEQRRNGIPSRRTTVTRLLPWLFGQPERSYHLSELRRLTALGSASLQRELNRLEESQLVQSTRVGNLRCFQANAQSPVYAELVSLTRKTMGAAPLLQQALQPMAAALAGGPPHQASPAWPREKPS